MGAPEGMCSTAGNENPSYSEGTTAISALAASSARSVSLIPCTNRTRSPRARSLTSFSVGPPAAGLSTTMSWPSRSTVILAKAWSSVDTPFSGESALATATIRPGTRGGCRGWEPRARAAGPPALHPDERVPAPLAAPGPAVGGRQLDPPVHADRVVDAGHQGQAEPGQAEQAVGQHLVVVDQVEVACPGAQRAQRPEAERERLGEGAGLHRAELQHVHPVP